jgi:hypothetical protein
MAPRSLLRQPFSSELTRGPAIPSKLRNSRSWMHGKITPKARHPGLLRVNASLDDSSSHDNAQKNPVSSLFSSNPPVSVGLLAAVPFTLPFLSFGNGGTNGNGNGGNGGDGNNNNNPGGSSSSNPQEIAIIADASDNEQEEDDIDEEEEEYYEDGEEEGMYADDEDEDDDDEELSKKKKKKAYDVDSGMQMQDRKYLKKTKDFSVDMSADFKPPEETGPGGFWVDSIEIKGLPKGEFIPKQEELLKAFNCRPGWATTKEELRKDLVTLYKTEIFSAVDAQVIPNKQKPGYFKVIFKTKPKTYTPPRDILVKPEQYTSARFISIPKDYMKKIKDTVLPKFRDNEGKYVEDWEAKGLKMNVQDYEYVRKSIEKWYHDRGHHFCYITRWGMDKDNTMWFNVVEGRTKAINCYPMGPDGEAIKNPKESQKLHVSPALIKRLAPFELGSLYSVDDGRKALNTLFNQLDLFDNLQIMPQQNRRDVSSVEVDVILKEKPIATSDYEIEWGIAPGDKGRPGLVSLVPGGTVTYENRNLDGKGAMFAASINTKNFVQPTDDLAYRMQFSVPYVHGLYDQRDTRLNGAIFNSRKLCGVFTPGPAGDEVPSIWIDRTGAKVSLSETYTRNSSGSIGLVAQQVSTLDETGAPVGRGARQTPLGQLIADGPPTAMSETGKDKLVYAQAALVRDTTRIVNGATVGARDVYTVSCCFVVTIGTWTLLLVARWKKDRGREREREGRMRRSSCEKERGP